MMILYRNTIRFFFVAFALTLPLSAYAANYDVKVLFDTDANRSTGCTVSTSSGLVAGVDQILTTSVAVNGGTATVTGVVRQLCSGGFLGAPIAVDAGGWNVGVSPTGNLFIETHVGANVITMTNIGTMRLVFTVTSGGRADAITSDFGDDILFPVRPGRRHAVSTGALRTIHLDGVDTDWAGVPVLAFGGAASPALRFLDTSAYVDSSDLFFNFHIQTNINAPTALDDSYSLSTLGGTLTVSTLGVLTNDSDPNNLALSAFLVEGPEHGTLTLNPNGGFTYVHDGSNTLQDHFRYRDTNGTLESNLATVTIRLPGPPSNYAFTSADHVTFTAGQFSLFTVTVTGKPTPALSEDGALPQGISFVDNGDGTGTLSGTPGTGTVGIYPIVFHAEKNKPHQTDQNFTLTVACPSITVTNPSVNTGTVGTPFSQTFTQAGGSTPITWSESGTLPAGLTFHTTTGVLDGTPTQGGTFPITVTATDASSCTGTGPTYTLTIVCNTITVTNPVVNTGTVNVAFSQTFTQVGGIGATTFSLFSGTLPTGLTLASNGTLSGTPTQTGSFPIKVKATDANGCSGVGATYTLTIGCQVITVTNPATNTGTVNVAFSQTFTAGNAIAPVTFTLNSGTLPAGITLSSAGVLSGTPTQTGSFTITVKATDANGCFGIGATYTLTIGCQVITVTNPSTNTGTVNIPFSQTFTASNAIGATTFTTASTLPTGITLSTGGVLSGTPTQTGSFPIVVHVVDANGCAGNGATYTLTIACQVITVNNPVTNSGTVNIAFSQTFTASNAIGATTFTTASTLPTGITLSTGGVLSGTPTQTGSFPIVVHVVDANGCAGNGATYTLTIGCQVITVNNPVTNTGTVNTAFSQTFTAGNTIGAVTFSLNSGTLPTGLSLSTGGVLSGTPLQTGSFPIVVHAVDANGCSGIGATYTLTIGCQVISVTNPSTTTGTVNAVFSQTFTAGNTVGSVTFTTAGPLPNGLSLSTAGVLSGTPTQKGSFPIVVHVVDGNGCPGDSATYNLNIACQNITVNNPANNTGTVSAFFSEVFTATNTIGTVTFTTASTLPNGITLASDGTLSGTPTQQGTFPLVITATDANGCPGTSNYSLIIACQTITVGNPTSSSDAAGTPLIAANFTFTQTGAVGGATFNTASTLPNGVTLTSAGVLTGTPTQGGNFPIVVTVTDGNGCTGTNPSYTLTITCPTILVTNPSTSNATKNSSFSPQTFTQSGGQGTITWSVFSGTVPSGMTFHPTTGVLDGTPTVTGNFPLVVRATDQNGCTGDGASYPLAVYIVPVAVADSYQTPRNSTLSVNAASGVLANDTINGGGGEANATVVSYGASTGLEDGTPGTATATSAGGSVTLNADGSFSYTTPNPTFSGPDTFKYKIQNPVGSSIATVTINVLPPPIAVNDNYSTGSNTPLTQPAAGVLTNDTLNGATITSYGTPNGTEQTTIGTSTATAQGGTIVLNADGSFTYTPANGFTGSDTFKYIITNVSGSSTGTVTILVLDPPIAVNDSYTAGENTPLTVAGASGVTSNDTLNTATIVSYGSPNGTEQTTIGNTTGTAQGGTIAISANGGFTYTPFTGFTGTDTVKYKIQNATGSSIATVTFTVLGPPIANPDNYQAPKDVTLNINAANGVLSNDTLNSATILSYGKTTGSEQTSIGSATPTAQSGSVTLNADGSFSYLAAAGFTGTDTFKYILSNAGGTSTTTVTFTVVGPPVAVDDTYSKATSSSTTTSAPGVLTNDTVNSATIFSYGINGNEQTTIGNSTPTSAGGSVSLNLNGSFNYTAPASATTDTFKYVIKNIAGTSTATVTINVLVQAAANPKTFAVTGNVPITVGTAPGVMGASGTNACTNSCTADAGTSITVKSYGASTGNEQSTPGTNTATASSGTININADGTFTYTPPANFTGSDSFKYKIDNGLNTPSTATVTLTVADRIIFVSPSGSGNCQVSSPCSLATADAVTTMGGAGQDLVFVESGTYNAATITLNNNQFMTGQAISGSAAAAAAGITLAANSAALPGASTQPILNSAATTCITLGSGNTIRLLTIQGAALNGINGNGVAGFIADSITVQNNTNIGVNLQSMTGTVTITNSNISTVGNQALTIDGGTASVTVNGTNTLAGGTGTAASVLNRPNSGTGAISIGATITGSRIQILSNLSGTISFTGSQTLSSGTVDAITLSTNSAAIINFSGTLNVTSTTGKGLIASTSGTLNVTGTANITTGAAGAGVDLSNITVGVSGVTFTSVNVTGATTAGVSLVNLTGGALAINGGTISAGATGFSISGGNSNVSDSGTITGSSSFLVDISGRTGGTATFSGAVGGAGTLAGTGIRIQTSTGAAAATYTFSGTQTLGTSGSRMANTAVTLTGNASNTVFNFSGTMSIFTTGVTAFTATGPTGGTINFSSNDSIDATTGVALVLNGVALGASTLGSVNASGAANGISLTTVTGGTLTISGGSLTGGAGAPFLVSAGTVSVTDAGTISQATASQPVVSISGGHTTGTITFNGNISATNGTGIQFDNADGTYAFNGASNALSGGAAVSIVNGSSGTFTFSSGTSITNATATDFSVDASAGNVTYNGTISDTSGRVVSVTNCGGGTKAFTGSITNNGGTGISLTSNTGTTISFSGTLVLSTGANAAFTATGGGTVIATGANSTITTTTATAVDASSVTFGSGGVNFKSISVNGATTGVNLNTTSGTFTVTGDGTGKANGSGGSIINITGGSVGNSPFYALSCSGTITLKSMNMSIAANTYGGMFVDNNSTSGTLAVNLTGCAISGAPVGTTTETAGLLEFAVNNTSGSQNETINIQNCYFNGGSSWPVEVVASTNAVVNATVNQCGFGTDVNSGAAVNNPGTTITNPPAFDVLMSNGGSAQITYAITNSTFWGADANNGAFSNIAVSGAVTTGTSFLNGSITGNNIGKTGVTGSGCANHCAGIDLEPGTAGTFTATIQSNNLQEVSAAGILARDTVASSTISAILHINTNTLGPPDTSISPVLQRAIEVDAGNSGGASANFCVDITGNTLTPAFGGTWPANKNWGSNTQFAIRLNNQNNNGGHFKVPGWGGGTGPTDTASVAAYVASLNTMNGYLVSAAPSASGTNFIGGASCP